ncbi:MAG: hypothetical protein NVS4B12_00110 [Ktedonobacteraceae bacterium]
MAAKAAPPTPAKTTVVHQAPPPPKPKQQVQSGTNQWLDKLSDVKIAEPDKPARPKIPSSPAPRDTRGGPGDSRDAGSPPGNSREDLGQTTYREREGNNRVPGNSRENTYRPSNSPYRVGGGTGLPDAGPRPRQPMEGGFNRNPRTDKPQRPAGQGGKPKLKTPKPPPPPKPKREKIEPPKPFEPTAEQITQVETRYLELATPVEFDGIRTQIAHELEIPKTAVKKIIKALRDRQHIPSWWEAQTYKGSEEELAKIKVLYEPYLPLPDIGVHKKIAEELSLKPGEVYQAIKKIRADMGLPQYNDPELHPELHGIELKSKKSSEVTEATSETPSETETQPVTEAASTTEAPPAPVPTDTLNDTDTEAVVDAVKEEAKPEEAPAEHKGELSEADTSAKTEV